MSARVLVLAYGVIGRRAADAVRAQEDMELIGVAGRATSPSLRDAALKDIPVYLVDDRESRFCQPAGALEDGLARCDVVLDCTPSGVPSRYRDALSKLPVIVQGGESHEFAGTSFNAFANYRESLGRRHVRVISCSSTGGTRFLYTLDRGFGIRRGFLGLVRRAADPGKIPKLPLNSLAPKMGQSHHAPDIRTVLPHLDLYSMSVNTPTTLSHVIAFQVELARPASREEVLLEFERMPRVLVGEGLRSTAELAEEAEDAGRSRRDRPEIYVWRDGISVADRTVRGTIAVHMESITIPETVDCVRAVLEMETDPWLSIRRTDVGMGISKDAVAYEGREP